MSRYGRGRWARRAAVLLAFLVVGATVAAWGAGRWTAEGRRLTVVTPAGTTTHTGAEWVATPESEGVGDARREHPAAATVRILAWNIAHGRGDVRRGWLKNWNGSEAERRTRVERIADAIGATGADVVVLNEVDFDAGWSAGMNQAEIIARRAGYPYRIEQRNVDLRLPFTRFAFGNAILSRLPLTAARWVELPAHSRLESILFGAKDGVVARVRTPSGSLALMAVHLESREAGTRQAALPVFESLRAGESAPVVLAGDFNSGPAVHAGPAGDTSSAVDRLLGRGWRSPRAESDPSRVRPTFPTLDPERALDWVLVEPPLRVLEAHAVTGASALSDHVPVLSLVDRPPSS